MTFSLGDEDLPVGSDGMELVIRDWTLAEETVRRITIDHVLAVVGMGIFALWLLKNHYGTRALVHSRLRRNRMPVLMPLMIFLGWWLGINVVVLAVGHFVRADAGGHRKLILMISQAGG